MTKTLGEIAKAARDAIDYMRTHENERWEIVASAVAEEVRKQCIAACEAHLIDAATIDVAHTSAVRMCIAAIKDLT